MNGIRKLGGTLISCLALGCAGTVTAQLVGAGVLWSRGMLERDKLVRYAGVIYGLDPLDLTAAPPGEAPGEPASATREAILAERAANSPAIRDRQAAIRKGTDDIRTVVLALKVKRERQDTARKAFEGYLQQLESENKEASLRQLYITLESLPPQHAKEILRVMLTDAPDDPRVMQDVVAVLQMMPTDKVSKTLGEFKTEEERMLLHEILVQIGNLGHARASLSGA